jgi:heme exporter protein CcmB
VTPFWRAALAVAGKDLRVELRGREVVTAMAFFGVLVILLFAFAFIKEGEAPPDAAAGILWITVALAGTLGLGRAFDREREHDTLSALLLAPVPRAAIYVGKLAGICTFMLVTELAAAPLVTLLFDAPLSRHPAALALLLALGTLGYGAVGALFAAMLARSRGRHVLLGILLYPIIIPVLIGGARGTQALLAPQTDWDGVWLWCKMLTLFDVAFVVLALWTFDPLVGSGE